MKYKIRELRDERGWTQRELGDKFKKAKKPEIICRWEKGRGAPGAKHLLELAEIFGVVANNILID